MIKNYKFKIFILSIVLKLSSAHADELKQISQAGLLQENPSTEYKIVINYLVDQFIPKKGLGVTQKMLDQLWNDKNARKDLLLCRFQIINQIIYADSYHVNDYYYQPLLTYFVKLSKKYKINDIDFIVYGRDEIPINRHAHKIINTTAFMMSKNLSSVYEKDMLLLPDAYIISSKWQDLILEIEQNNCAVSLSLLAS